MQTQENEVVYLHLDDIIPNRFQPRQVFDEKALKELAVSIKEHGVIQPIIVRNIGNKYEIIAGERRYKASAMAGLTKIPAIVRNLDDQESSKVALIENLQRKNLNPIEEAKTYQKILELDQMTQEELAKTMGKSQGAVANKLRLLSLTDEVQDALLKDQISERHARTLLSVTDSEEQKKLLKEVIDNKMTVRELEDKIKPKEENITPQSIDDMLNPKPVNLTEPLFNNNVTATNNVNSPSDFNQSVGIDYSTPPKFIDYDIPNINSENLESTANKQIDINALKDSAKDINIEPEEKNVDIDQFLKVAPKEEPKPQEASFKFFAPEEDMTPKQDQQPSQNEQSQAFVAPTPTNISDVNPFDLNAPTKSLDDATSTSMDNLLAGVENQNTNTNTNQAINLEDKKEAEEKIPPVDVFNNPFARNPIFGDNIKEESAVSISTPKYTLNESINLVRETLRKIENSGFKVETTETDLANNYQITIKIAKENT